MIIGIGHDIIDAKRIEKSIAQFGQKFIDRIFTKNEIAQFEKFENQSRKINFLAKRFAAKEAFSKAVGSGIGEDFSFKEIEIYNEKSGKPNFKISQEKTNFLAQKFQFSQVKFHLSLSDEGDFCSAFVLIEGML